MTTKTDFTMPTYDVAIDPASFHSELDNPTDGSSMIPCRIGISGNTDHSWQKEFRSTRLESIEDFFYRLSEDGQVVHFLASRIDGATNVMVGLRMLIGLLRVVNTKANRSKGTRITWSAASFDKVPAAVPLEGRQDRIGKSGRRTEQPQLRIRAS